MLLRRLIDESSVSDLIDRVDMFAGTSTGGLIALGLAAEIPLNRIRDLYLREGPKIFAENFFGQFRVRRQSVSTSIFKQGAETGSGRNLRRQEIGRSQTTSDDSGVRARQSEK